MTCSRTLYEMQKYMEGFYSNMLVSLDAFNALYDSVLLDPIINYINRKILLLTTILPCTMRVFGV